MKSNGAGAEFNFKITEKYLFLLLRVQLQCNVDEEGGKYTEVYLPSLRVNIAPESVKYTSATVRFYISTLTHFLTILLQDFIHPC